MSKNLTSAGESYRSLITPLNEDTIVSRMFSLWPQIDRGSLNSSSFREKYQDNGATDLDPRFENLGRVGNATLSIRLTVALNSFWMLS
jgi:hypothetical protein